MNQQNPRLTLRLFLRQTYGPRKLLAASAIEQIEFAINSLEKWAARIVYLDELSNDLICAWMAFRLGKCERSTVKRERQAIRSLWLFALSPSMRAKCPALELPELPTIQTPKKAPRAMRPDALEAILFEAGRLRSFLPLEESTIRWSHWAIALLATMYETGARITALLNVAPADVSFQSRTIRLSWMHAKKMHEQVLPLSDQSLRAIRKIWSAERDQVWPWPYTKREIWRWLKRLAKRAGVPLENYQAFHSVRKTTATVMTACSDIGRASQQLGHSSIEMTLSRYVDPQLLNELRGPAVHVMPALRMAEAGCDRQLMLW